MILIYTQKLTTICFSHKQYCYFLDYINKDAKTIYHYTSIETMENILKTSSLRFTNINDLNDECEFTFLFTILHDRISFYRLKYDKEFCDNLLDVCLKYCDENCYYVGERVKKDIERDYYISSFSHADDNLPLWTLYTKEKNFIGCNFGVDRQSFKTIEYTNGPVWMGNVIYSEKEQIRILDELIASWYNYYEKVKFDNYFKGDIHDALYQYALFFKHPAFEHEKEFRFIYHPANNNEFNIFNEKRYIDIKFNLIDEIKSVKLSPTLKENIHIENIKKLFKRYNTKTQTFEISDIPFCV